MNRYFVSNHLPCAGIALSDHYPFGSIVESRSWRGGIYRFGFNGMENDDEVLGAGNSLDFGARVYDSRLGRWLSLDQAEGLYNDFAPYIFCADNPVLFQDIEGRLLIIYGKTDSEKQAAKLDVLSLVPEEMRSAVTFSEMENGQLSVHFGVNTALLGTADGGGSGPLLLHNLVNAKEKYLYQVTNDDYEVQIKLSNGKFLSRKDKMAPNDFEVNLSTTKRFPFNEGEEIHNQADKRPKEGFDGMVVISSKGKWTENGSPKKRSSIVFHELWENYERTTNKLPYDYPLRDKLGKIIFKSNRSINPVWDAKKTGAHDKAIQAEESFHDKSEKPGQVD